MFIQADCWWHVVSCSIHQQGDFFARGNPLGASGRSLQFAYWSIHSAAYTLTGTCRRRLSIPAERQRHIPPLMTASVILFMCSFHVFHDEAGGVIALRHRISASNRSVCIRVKSALMCFTRACQSRLSVQAELLTAHDCLLLRNSRMDRRRHCPGAPLRRRRRMHRCLHIDSRTVLSINCMAFCHLHLLLTRAPHTCKQAAPLRWGAPLAPAAEVPAHNAFMCFSKSCH